MIKIVRNNLIIDVCAGENYLRFLPNHKRFLSVERSLANAVIGSDNNTIYHIQDTPYNFLNELEYHLPKYLYNHPLFHELSAKKKREFTKILTGLEKAEIKDYSLINKYSDFLKEIEKI